MPAIGQLYRVVRVAGPGASDPEARGIVSLAMSTDPRFAEPTPFARLVYAHAVSVAGDACLTVSLAGSLFFSVPRSTSNPRFSRPLVAVSASSPV